MNRRFFSAALSVLCLLLAGTLTQAQTRRAYRGTVQSVRNTIHRIENRSNVFRNDLETWTSNNPTDTYSTAANEDINLFVRDFDESVRRLHYRFDRRQ